MAIEEMVNNISAKIDRASKHLGCLEVEVNSFLSSRPYIIGTKRDAETRRLIYYLVSVRSTPICLAAIAGDVIQNLRSALDHLAYQLVVVGTGKNPSTRIYFPIAEDAKNYNKQRNDKTQGMRQSAIKAIDALKPFKGGNDTLWLLHKLNIIDKHRMLLTVGSAYHSVGVGHILQREMQEGISSFPGFEGETIPLPNVVIKPSDVMFPLKTCDELFTDKPDAEPSDKIKFVFEVAFGEPHLIEGKPLIETIKHMADMVNKVVSSFIPLLK